MQQLESTEKKDIIEHAARKIVIIYEPGKTTLTAQDEQLLNAYLRLHDFEEKLMATANELFRDFGPVSKKINNLKEELKNVQATFDECLLLADKLCAVNYETDEASLEELGKNQEQASKVIFAYNEEIMKVYKKTESLSKRVEQYNEASEDEANSLYDEFSKISTDHSINWQNNAIDIAAFEDEYEDFDSYRTVSEKRRESLMNFCDATSNDYVTLGLQTNSLYAVWKEFLKRCQLLRSTAELHTAALRFTNN
jgi:hypothetical protein